MVLNCRFRYAHAPSWIAMRDLLHLRRALVLRQHLVHEEEADGDGHEGRRRREHQDGPLGASEVERLVTAFGGKY